MIPPKYGYSYTTTEEYPHLLVRRVRQKISFSVTNAGLKYLVLVGYWSKDVDYHFVYCEYDPVIKDFAAQGKGSGMDKEVELRDLIESYYS